MELSKRMLEMVKFYEGCYLTAYWDKYGGVWTIGYGHTGPDVYEGLTITQEQADALFNQDMASFKNFVDTIPISLNQNEYSALVSFSFNCGMSWLHNSETGSLLLSNNKKGFANRILLYNKGNDGVSLLGLYRRRLAERALFLYGVSHYYQEITSIPSDVVNNIPQPDPPEDERPDLGDGGGTVDPPDPPDPTGDYKIMTNYIFNHEDKLFGVKFTSLSSSFKLIDIVGDRARLKDSKGKIITVNKKYLKKV